MIGTYLDELFITSRLGTGSLGITYLAEKPGQTEKVVVKVLNRELLHTIHELPQLRERWQTLLATENRRGSADDPSGAFVHQITDDYQYLLSEYEKQGNLHDYLQKLRLQGKWIQADSQAASDSEDALAKTAVTLIHHLTLQIRHPRIVNRGLEYHGGLHPRNILVHQSPSDRPITLTTFSLTDFGHAALAQQATAQSIAAFAPLAHFSPPGEALAEKIDDRADLYALGQLLYYLLTQTYLPVSSSETFWPTIDAEFAQLEAAAAAKDENMEQAHVSLRQKATYLALTAVRIYRHGSGKPNIWARWQYALEQFLSGQFSIAASLPDDSEPVSDVDAVWRGIDNPLKWTFNPEQFQPWLLLPNMLPTGDAAPAAHSTPPTVPDTKTAVSDITIRITNTETGQQTTQLFEVPPDQRFITIGSDANRDIVLTNDDQIASHHLDLRRQQGEWRIWPRANQTEVANTPLQVGANQVWTPDQPIQVGKYELHLWTTGEKSETQIGVTLLPTVQTIEAGIRSRVGISIQNRGNQRGYFKLQIHALPSETGTPLPLETVADWFTLPQDGIVLNQQEQQELPLYIEPQLNAPAGKYTYAITVTHITPTAAQRTVRQEKGELRIVAGAAFAVQLKPETSQNNGRFALFIHNRSNHPTRFDITSEDPAQQLRFALTTVDESQYVPPAPARRAAQTAVRPPSMLPPTLNQIPGFSRVTRLFTRVRQPVTQAQRTQQRLGRLLPDSPPATSKRVETYSPDFTETFSYQTGSIPAQGSHRLTLLVKPRQRPFRWQAPNSIPFSLLIKPDPLPADVEPEKATAVLQTTGRLSRSSTLLLFGLLLLLGLGLTGFGAFRTNEAVGLMRTAQETAVAGSPLDPDGDGLSTFDEITKYFTDPNNPDTDGDGLKDGVEVLYQERGICPQRIDCDRNGIPDLIQLRYATPQPTPQPGEQFITAVPPPTATVIPTVTPTVSPIAETVSTVNPTRLAILPSNPRDSLVVGDDAQNQSLTVTLTFDLSQLPANAQINEAVLVVPYQPLSDSLATLQNRLGNLTATIGNIPLAQSVAPAQEAAPTTALLMLPVPNSSSLLYTEITPDRLSAQSELSVTLYFQQETNLNGRAEQLRILMTSDQEDVPALHLAYLPSTAESEEAP